MKDNFYKGLSFKNHSLNKLSTETIFIIKNTQKNPNKGIILLQMQDHKSEKGLFINNYSFYKLFNSEMKTLKYLNLHATINKRNDKKKEEK